MTNKGNIVRTPNSARRGLSGDSKAYCEECSDVISDFRQKYKAKTCGNACKRERDKRLKREKAKQINELLGIRPIKKVTSFPDRRRIKAINLIQLHPEIIIFIAKRIEIDVKHSIDIRFDFYIELAKRKFKLNFGNNHKRYFKENILRTYPDLRQYIKMKERKP